MDIDFDGYTYTVDFSSPLGRGAYGAVFPGFMKDDPEEKIVVKLFFFNENDPMITYLNWSEEVESAHLLGIDEDPRCSPYFVCYVGNAMTKLGDTPAPLIAYKRAWGDMNKFIDSYRTYVNDETRFVFIKSMLMALKELRSRGLAHRDIKTENILVYRQRNEWSFVLGDLGSLCALQGDTLRCDADAQNRTTITSLPPIIRTRSKSQSNDPVLNGYMDAGVDDTGYRTLEDMMWADIYAMGCVIYTFLTGDTICKGRLQDVRPLKMPYIGYTDDDGIYHSINGKRLADLLTVMIYSPTYQDASMYEMIDIYNEPQDVGTSIFRSIGKSIQRTARYRISARRKKGSRNK